MLSLSDGMTVIIPTFLESSINKSESIGPAPLPVPPPEANMTNKSSALTVSSMRSAILSKSSTTSCLALSLSLLQPSPPLI